MLQAIGIVAVTAVGWPPRGLYVGYIPGFRPDGTEKGGRVKRPGAHFHIIGLQNHTAMPGPVLLQTLNQFLECHL